MLRIVTPTGVIVLRRARPGDARSETPVDGWLVESALKDAIQGRRLELAHVRSALGLDRMSDIANIVTELEEGRLQARFEHRVRFSIPFTRPPALGPDSTPPAAVEFTWMAVKLLDAEGVPVPRVACEMTPPNEDKPRKKALGEDGTAILDDVREGSGRVLFEGLADRDKEPLDEEASQPKPFPSARSIVRAAASHEPFSVTTGSEHVFQLRRPVVEVIEIEHFFPGSAVFQPGPSPWDPKRGPQGIDVLRMALTHANTFPTDRTRVVGHVASNEAPEISKHRATVVRALLAGDRDAFVAAVQAANVERDVDALSKWAAGTFGWGPTLLSFQTNYSAQPWGEPIPATGILDDATWGAFFVCIERALTQDSTSPTPATQGGTTPAGRPIGPAYLRCRPTDSFAPITLAKDARGSEVFYTELTPLNPHLVSGNNVWRRNIYAGDEINLPDNWLGNGVLRRKYEIHDKEPDPQSAGTIPLLSDPPKIAACGSNHVTRPFEGAPERRNVQRHVEVIFFGPDEATDEICTFDGACNHSTCWLYDPKEYTHVFRRAGSSETPAIDVTWRARWDAATVSRGGERTMILIAPDLIAGEEVEFEVFQGGVGSIGKTIAQSEVGKATAKWSDWFHPSRATASSRMLERGQSFDEGSFHFTASAMGKERKTLVPCTYADAIEVQMIYSMEGRANIPAKGRDYTVHTPWGTRKGKTAKKGNEEGFIVERGLPPGGASVVIGKRTLVAQTDDGSFALLDRRARHEGAEYQRFCDVHRESTGLRFSYRILCAFPRLRAAQDDRPGDVTFEVRRLVRADVPKEGDEVVEIDEEKMIVVDERRIPATIRLSDPYLWEMDVDFYGAEGWMEIVTRMDGVEKLRETLDVSTAVEEV